MSDPETSHTPRFRPPALVNLPTEIVDNIASYLSWLDVASLTQTCKSLHEKLSHEFLTRNVHQALSWAVTMGYNDEIRKCLQSLKGQELPKVLVLIIAAWENKDEICKLILDDVDTPEFVNLSTTKMRFKCTETNVWVFLPLFFQVL